jgi:hypothetical protein
MQYGAAPLGLILLGLTLGIRHATDPDHVVAVTAILTGERGFFSAVRIGLIWGLGHSITVLTAGMAIILFKLKVPARLGLSLEFMVAIVLILLGLRAAKETLAWMARILRIAFPREAALVVHSHRHSHEPHGPAHTHRHVHAHSASDNHDLAAHDHLVSPELPEKITGRSIRRSFAVGLVHGLAGSAAIALLIAAAIPWPWWATFYMGIFCAGVMVGMVLITAAIGAPLVWAAQRLTAFHGTLAMAAGWLSFGFGVFLAYQIGVADQLFGAAPRWLPH